MNYTSLLGVLILSLSNICLNAMESIPLKKRSKKSNEDLSVLEQPKKVIPVLLEEEIEQHGEKLKPETMINLIKQLSACAGTTPSEELLVGTKLKTGREKDTLCVSLLHYACSQGTPELVDKLLSLGNNREMAPSIVTDTGETLLHFAVANGKAEIARLLIEKFGVDVNRPDEHGQTALFVVHEDAADCIELLVLAGAQVNHLDNEGASALHWATFRENEALAKMLLKHGAQTNILSKGEDPRTPLYNAVQRRNIALVTLLLDHGADAKLAGPDGYTPLHLAAEFDQTGNITRALLKHGALSNQACNIKGRTPLIYALKNKRRRNAGILLKKNNPLVDHQDHKGKTALHYAAKHSLHKLVELILKKNPDKELQDNEGKTAADLAVKNSKIHKALLNGATPSGHKSRKRTSKITTVLDLTMEEEEELVLQEESLFRPKKKNRKKSSLNEREDSLNTSPPQEVQEHMSSSAPAQQSALILLNEGLLERAIISVRTMDQDLLMTNGYGQTLLHRAVIMGSYELVDALLEKAPGLIHCRDLYGKTALHFACEQDAQQLVARLLQQKDCHLTIADKNGSCPIDLAKNDVTKQFLNFFIQNLKR